MLSSRKKLMPLDTTSVSNSTAGTHHHLHITGLQCILLIVSLSYCVEHSFIITLVVMKITVMIIVPSFKNAILFYCRNEFIQS